MQRFFATCPKGLEYLLRDELVALGAQAREALAGVHFEGTLETAYRACLWSRLASRILMPLAEFEAPDGEALYRGVAAVDWAQHFGVGARFAIDAHGSTRGITNTLASVSVNASRTTPLTFTPSVSMPDPSGFSRIFVSGSGTRFKGTRIFISFNST